jgi:hypothetical protein
MEVHDFSLGHRQFKIVNGYFFRMSIFIPSSRFQRASLSLSLLVYLLFWKSDNIVNAIITSVLFILSPRESDLCKIACGIILKSQWQ